MQALLLEVIDGALGNRQISGTQDHDHAILRLDESPHLLEAGHLVNPGIGSRVGGEDQTAIQFEGDAISHSKFLMGHSGHLPVSHRFIERPPRKIGRFDFTTELIGRGQKVGQILMEAAGKHILDPAEVKAGMHFAGKPS